MIDVKSILSSDRERIAFAERAAAYFNEHPDCMTFTDGECKVGVLFAVRWADPRGRHKRDADAVAAARGLAEAFLAGGATIPLHSDTTAKLARALIDCLPTPGKVISVLVFELPFDAVLVGDLDTK